MRPHVCISTYTPRDAVFPLRQNLSPTLSSAVSPHAEPASGSSPCCAPLVRALKCILHTNTSLRAGCGLRSAHPPPGRTDTGPMFSKMFNQSAHPESSTPITTLPPLSLKDSLQFCVDKRQVAAVTDIGGATVDEATKRMMTFLLDHALSRQYNFLGRNGKREFKALKLYEVIYGGLKKNAMTSQITRKDAEKAVSKWLIGARDRGGNRQARQATPQQGL
ncbi:hypothetical protein Q8A67_011345 [Cirrhinus molitorella]|uniref:DUF4806 domain-containing protein n=1 Tax=Cirrhinus molitorella TaxID=172907 RepID=A0AA88TPH7_9TELE|nr:hypothetical protein Q8A67_011345 [Cirrhinus molitorella]